MALGILAFVMKNWKLWHWLVLAFVIRLYKVAQIHCIAKDGTQYIEVAKSWLSGVGFHPVWPPLYPWFISLLMKLGIRPELSGAVISVIFGVLTVALVYKAVKDIFGQDIAQIAAVFSVFHPYLVRYSAEVLADSLFTFLIVFVVYYGWVGLRRNGVVPTLCAGIGAALAYLTKPEGMFLLVVVTLWWGFSAVAEGRWIRKLAVVLCAWAIFIILIFPYLYSVRNETGEWTISQKQNLVFSTALRQEGFTEEFLDVSPAEYAVKNPGSFFMKTGKSFLTLLGRFIDAYNPFLFILLIIGLFYKWEPRQKKSLLYIFSFVILYFIGYAIFHPGRRYLVSWVPLLLVLAGAGYIKAVDVFSNINSLRIVSRQKVQKILLVIIILLLLPKTLAPERKQSYAWKEAGLWIDVRCGNKPRIIAEDMRVAFYADGKYIPWTEGNFSEADYIVVKDPGLSEQLKDLKTVEIFTTSKGVKIYDVSVNTDDHRQENTDDHR